MKRHFDDEIKKLKDKLLKMGFLVEEAIQHSTEALFARDNKKADEVIKRDQEINLYEIEIDELAHELIARYQPAARDLRLITMILKINNDLERMGDQAVNIAEKAQAVSGEVPFKPYQDLPPMANRVLQMVRDSLSAFMEEDPVKASVILEGDDIVDRCNDDIYTEVQKLLESKPEHTRAGVGLIMVAHNMERIADLATNIAEDVIYLQKGIDVRHHIRERRGDL